MRERCFCSRRDAFGAREEKRWREGLTNCAAHLVWGERTAELGAMHHFAVGTLGRMNADTSRNNLRGRGKLPRGMGAKMRGGVAMSIFCGDAPSADMKELSRVTSAQEGSLTTRATIAFSGALHSICADRRLQDVTDTGRIPPFGQSGFRLGCSTKSTMVGNVGE
jgi:hypothetical protein